MVGQEGGVTEPDGVEAAATVRETSVTRTDILGTEESAGEFDIDIAASLGYNAGVRNPYWDFLWRQYDNEDKVKGGSST